jgi:hypothetical protein
MPERDPKLLEVPIGQMAKDRNINIVFGKALGVLAHAEFFEPVRNSLHRGHQQFCSPSEPSQRAHTNISTTHVSHT